MKKVLFLLTLVVGLTGLSPTAWAFSDVLSTTEFGLNDITQNVATWTSSNGITYVGPMQRNSTFEAFMMNTTNPTIYSNTPGYYVSKVVVKVQGSTGSFNLAGKDLAIYGSNNPYSSRSDLLSESTRGEEIGIALAGSNGVNTTTITPSEKYEYIGFTYTNGNCFVKEIEVFWEPKPSFPDKPKFSLPAGTYNQVQSVTLTAADGIEIYYTTDGTPVALSSDKQLYTGPITVDHSMTIRAIAYDSANNLWSEGESSATYVLQAPAPFITPDAGDYVGAQQISIIPGLEGSVIRYTLDGSTPNEESALYEGPFVLSGNTTVKARAYYGTFDPSEVVTSVFNITIPTQVLTPTFSPGGGEYTEAQTVEITSSIGSTIYYSLDGSYPNTLYTEPVVVDANSILKARATMEGFVDSEVATAVYTFITGAPSLSSEGGSFNDYQEVTITAATGADIYYSFDDFITTLTYTGDPVVVAKSSTLKAKAQMPGWNESAPVAAEFTLKVAAPTFSVPSGKYAENKTVEIGSATTDAEIRYTLDGTAPTEESAIYSEALIVENPTTVKAQAFKGEMTASDVATAEYEIVDFISDDYCDVINTSTWAFNNMEAIYPHGPVTPGKKSEYDACVKKNPATGCIMFGQKEGAIVATKSGGVIKKVEAKIRSNFSGSLTGYNLYVYGRTEQEGPYSGYADALNADARGELIATFEIPNSTSDYKEFSFTPTKDYAYIAFAANQSSPCHVSEIKIYWEDIPQVETPVISLESGVYEGAQDVTITCASRNSSILYTLNGEDPTSQNGTVYTEPIHITGPVTTLKAIGVAPGRPNSAVASATYEIYSEGATQNPAFSPAPGTYTSAQTVTIASEDGADIYYTTNGDEPTTESTLYTEAITVDRNMTIKAIAQKTGANPSEVVVAAYNLKSAAPQISVEAGKYDKPITVAITATEGASIYYTLDGEEPTVESTLYTEPITLNTIPSNITLKAIAINPGWSASDAVSATYNLVNFIAEEKSDYITAETLGTTDAQAKEVTKQFNSEAVYNAKLNRMSAVGAMMFGQNSTALVTNKAGGEVKKVTVKMKSYVSSISMSLAGYNLYIYGKKQSETAYEGYADMFDADKCGELIKIIEVPSTTNEWTTIEFTPEPGYAYLGFACGPSNPAHVGEIKIDWNSIPQVNNPEITVTGNEEDGIYTDAATVAMSCDTYNSTIYYTLDGTNPTEVSNLYTEAFTLDAIGVNTVKAKAFKNGVPASDIVTATFKIQKEGELLAEAVGNGYNLSGRGDLDHHDDAYINATWYDATAVKGDAELTVANPNAHIFVTEGQSVAHNANTVVRDENGNYSADVMDIQDEYAFNFSDEIDCNKVNYSRQNSTRMISGIYPFDIVATDKVFKFKDFDGVNLNFVSVEAGTTIPAYTPVMVDAENNNVELSLQGVSIAKKPDTGVGEMNITQGAYDLDNLYYGFSTSVLEGLAYEGCVEGYELYGWAFINGSSTGQFAHFGEGSKYILKPFRATFLLKQPTGGNGQSAKSNVNPSLQVTINGKPLAQYLAETTGAELNTVDPNAANAPIYNVQGQRVASGYRGIIIENGSKRVNR